MVTGLFLGESADRQRRFAFRVSPRGAAQKVYRQELRRGMDPALLEQVGPRQYRVRVFPIPPRPHLAEQLRLRETPRLHLWLSYRTLAQAGTVPLPVGLDPAPGTRDVASYEECSNWGTPSTSKANSST